MPTNVKTDLCSNNFVDYREPIPVLIRDGYFAGVFDCSTGPTGDETTLGSIFNQFLMQVFLMQVFLIVIQSFPLYKYCINYTLGSVSIIG